MNPALNNPIPSDLNRWLEAFPGIKAAYDQLLLDIAANKTIVPATYYKIATDNTITSHNPLILAVRVSVFIWVETGQLDTETFGGLHWSCGDQLITKQNSEINQTALVIIGTNKNVPGALIYINEDKILRWETASDESLFEKAS